MLLALGDQDAEHLTSLIIRVGKAPANLDRSSLTLDITDFLAHYSSQPLDQFDLSGALREITELIRRYNIMLPARIAMLIKALITLEGTSQIGQPEIQPGGNDAALPQENSLAADVAHAAGCVNCGDSWPKSNTSSNFCLAG